MLAEFADICVNDNGKWYGDLALYFAECATDFTLDYGDIYEDFYEVLGDAYHDAVVAAGQDEELYKLWKDRLESVLHDFAGFGWRMEEYICEEYYSLPWIQVVSLIGLKHVFYLVLYIPDGDTQVVTIIHVMYGGRDVDMQLKRFTKTK